MIANSVSEKKEAIEDVYNKYLAQVNKIEIINRTFNQQYKVLPNISWLKKFIIIDNYDITEFNSLFRDYDNIDDTLKIRGYYVKFSFYILNHQFFCFLKNFVAKKEIKNIAELNCGAGWFSYWAKKYGINIVESVDDFSWQNRQSSYFDFVKKENSIDYVAKKEKEEMDLYILSWAPINDVAYEIWLSMKKGQYLLFIGEGPNGCTANNSFFETVKDCEVTFLPKNKQISVSFWSVHDYPQLYLKG